MGLEICILGSGSSGNCTYVASEQTALLIDAGLSARAVERRLGEIGRSLAMIRGVCVSHEHGDHTQGLRVLHQRAGIPLYANGGTIEALRRNPEFAELRWQVFTTGAPFTVGDLVVEPFSVPHDAYEPVGFVIAHGDARVGVVTDMGLCTTLIRERLRHCQAVVVESNHDEQMLQDAQRPWHLKQRIRGRQGHLSNAGAASLLVDIAGPQLRQVFLAHLSEDCNSPDLARKTAHDMLLKAGHTHINVSVTHPDRPTEVWAG
ncbi:MAG TPA: MBL fold metallo-hydrolase [Kiritimatiellia bacterium]|nr:MBL fold metallo-hydrolase [Kiritimatiellia bacterium]